MDNLPTVLDFIWNDSERSHTELAIGTTLFNSS